MSRFEAAVSLNEGLIEEQFYGLLLKFVNRRVSVPEDAEEIVQTIYLNLLMSKNSVNEEKIQSWLYRSARNAIVDYYRKKSVEPVKETLDLNREIAISKKNEAEIGGKDSIAACLLPLMKSLGDEEANLLEEIDINGVSQKEFAAKNNISYSTLKSKVQASRKKLKNKLLRCCKMRLNSRGTPVDFEDSEDCC